MPRKLVHSENSPLQVMRFSPERAFAHSSSRPAARLGQLALLIAGPIVEKLEAMQMDSPDVSSGSSVLPLPATRPPPRRET